MGHILEALQALAKKVHNPPLITAVKTSAPLTPPSFTLCPWQTHAMTTHLPMYGVLHKHLSLPANLTESSYHAPSESFHPINFQQSTPLMDDSPCLYGATFPYPQTLPPRPFCQQLLSFPHQSWFNQIKNQIRYKARINQEESATVLFWSL